MSFTSQALAHAATDSSSAIGAADHRIRGSEFVWPALAGLLLVAAVLYAIAFDQGSLASLVTSRLMDSGGVLHEFFHDARHLLGVPCH